MNLRLVFISYSNRGENVIMLITCIRVTTSHIGFVNSTLTQLHERFIRKLSHTMRVIQVICFYFQCKFYPDKAATISEENIPTDPSPLPSLIFSSAAASALFLNI